MNGVDLEHLRRCIALAAEAVDRGDDPFGSVLVGGDGEVLAERSNQVVTTDDPTAHPELALAIWAARNLDAPARRAATMYTSGEHCPMCATAHVRAGIGRLVYVLASPMIADLLGTSPTIDLRVSKIVTASTVHVDVEGPCHELVYEASALFGRR